jgi:hypothetical protein
MKFKMDDVRTEAEVGHAKGKIALRVFALGRFPYSFIPVLSVFTLLLVS